VKVLEVDPEAQRMSLSIKAALPVADSDTAGGQSPEDALPPPAPLVPQRSEPLRGGNDRPSGGEQFGLKW
jgi:small subunit ribosomal protein S1